MNQPYFKRRQSLAFGITAGGAGVGVALMPLIIRFLFDNYGYSGALLPIGM